MGASSWSYFTDYQEDVSAALQSLRRKIFLDGAFLKPPPSIKKSALPEAYIRLCEEYGRGNPTVMIYTAQLIERLGAYLPKPHELSQEDINDFNFSGELLFKAMDITDSDVSRLEQICARRGIDYTAVKSEVQQNIKPSSTDSEAAPNDIDELIEQCGTQGTHSIIDITTTGRTPALGVACPIPDAKLIELYGSQEPSRKQLTQSEGIATELLPSGFCYYTCAFDSGSPVAWYFEGSSGD